MVCLDASNYSSPISFVFSKTLRQAWQLSKWRWTTISIRTMWPWLDTICRPTAVRNSRIFIQAHTNVSRQYWSASTTLGSQRWSTVFQSYRSLWYDWCDTCWQCSMAKFFCDLQWFTAWHKCPAMDGADLWSLLQGSSQTLLEYARKSSLCWQFWLYTNASVRQQWKSPIRAFYVRRLGLETCSWFFTCLLKQFLQCWSSNFYIGHYLGLNSGGEWCYVCSLHDGQW